MATAEQVLKQYRDSLVIDKNKLDDCLMEQPELYYHVAEAYALAKGRHDSFKLDLKMAYAEEGQALRAEYVANEKKITESGLQELLLLTPAIEKLERAVLAEKRNMDELSALQEGFEQRSYMLRELVPLHLSRLSGGSVTMRHTHTLSDARGALGEQRYKEIGVERRKRAERKRTDD